jgi:hypothetical protein
MSNRILELLDDEDVFVNLATKTWRLETPEHLLKADDSSNF